VLGVCIGNRRLSGRPAWLVAGLVAGMLLGALIGWEWAHAEYAVARQQLLLAGLPAHFIDAPQRGFSVTGYESIGLQYGICLGVLGGTTAGWFWNHSSSSNSLGTRVWNSFQRSRSCRSWGSSTRVASSGDA
jgi:hypothetical protein